MRVEEILTFDDYWIDQRFQCKRPNLCGSKMQAFGDNIYHTDTATGVWLQANSFHSHKNGSGNVRNIKVDTSSVRVLIGSEFAYWGGTGPLIPARFRDFDSVDICAKRGHQNAFPEKMVAAFVVWLRSLGVRGYIGAPLDWTRSG